MQNLYDCSVDMLDDGDMHTTPKVGGAATLCKIKSVALTLPSSGDMIDVTLFDSDGESIMSFDGLASSGKVSCEYSSEGIKAKAPLYAEVFAEQGWGTDDDPLWIVVEGDLG